MLHRRCSILFACTVTAVIINKGLAFVLSPSSLINPAKIAFISQTTLMSLSLTEGKSNLCDDVRDYNSFISAAVDIVDASVHHGVISITRSARDLDSNSRRKFIYHIPLPTVETASSPIIPPSEIPSKIKARVTSPSGEKVALFIEDPKRNDGSYGDNGKTIVEVWTEKGQNLSHRIVLPSELHGAVCTNTEYFGSFSWNPEEDCIVYSAERCLPPTKSFFDSRSNRSLGGNKDNSVINGGEHTLGLGKGENWGEKYTSTHRLDLYCLNVITGRVGMVSNVPGKTTNAEATITTEGGFVLGQAVFSPCGTHVVYTGWDAGGGGSMPRRLGALFCYQRPSKIYASPVTQMLDQLSCENKEIQRGEDEGPFICISPNDRLARSPRFSSGKSGSDRKLIYLCNSIGFDTHGGCMGLHMVDWDEEAGALFDTWRELVKPVKILDETQEMAFPGLFVDQLPKEPCTSPDGKNLYATTQWGCRRRIIRISLETGKVSPICFNIRSESDNDKDSVKSGFAASQSLLCVTENGDALVSQSTPCCPTTVGFLPCHALDNCISGRNEDAMSIRRFYSIAATSVFTPTPIGDFTYFNLFSSPKEGKVKSNIEGILLLPPLKDGVKPPLLVVPHGGPHVASSTSFIPTYAFLCQQGYAILHTNYRGSTGYGQSALESLTGEVGYLDVEDVVALTKQALSVTERKLDANRVGICGGSHGGFLAAHLIGQYPQLFKVAAMRNPVTNIATMVSHTDIPDWCYVETLGVGSYNWNNFRGPKKEELNQMWEKSPIAHIDKVTAPTLIALGMADKRVPPSQGLEYYHSLRSRGVKTKLLTYVNDDHAIDNVASEADHWLNIKRWFDEHL